MSIRKVLSCKTEVDAFSENISKAFDYDFTGESKFECLSKPRVPKEFSLGVIHGSSGSGKTTLLKEFGDVHEHSWEKHKSIASHFDNPDEAIDKLSSVGLNSIPSWLKPYHVLSTGEKFRADLARSLKDGAVIDEFTSVVNRSVAKSASVSISKYIKRVGLKNIVLATCHHDILDWLEPDWSYDTDRDELSVGRCLRRPSIRIRVFEASIRWWEMFKRHHYLSADINRMCKCFVGTWEDEIVAFSASIPLPNKIPPLYEGDTRKKYRESRTVVLPDYQGIGIGVRFSDAVAEHWLNSGYRFFSKTAHIRMGEYRQKSDLWRPTTTNLKSREKSQKCSKKEAWHHYKLDTERICYSHEYIGEIGTKYRDLYEKEIKDENARGECGEK